MNAMMLLERNYKSLLLAALLVGAVSTASAGTPCGDNLEWELDGSTLVLSSPNPYSAATIYAQAFRNKENFTDVIIPDNVTQIHTKAFENCTALTNVVIPASVDSIGVEAFKGCSALSDVLCRRYYAPELGTDAFTNCHASLQICVPALGTYRYETNWSHYYDETRLTACIFLDENDEQSNTEAKINAYRTASLTDVDIFRTLRKAGCFNTLTLPFNVPDISASPLGGDNVEVYEFVGAEVLDGALQLDIAKVTSNTLSAGTPYLIQWNSTGEVMTRLHFSGITAWDSDNNAESTSGNIKLHGFYGKTHINDATDGEQHLNLFLQGGNQLYWPTDGSNDDAKMLGFRAWFQITGNTLAGAPIRRDMPASLRIVQTPTDINPVTGNPSPVTEKVLRNGQIIIIRNGEQYSITGQKL